MDIADCMTPDGKIDVAKYTGIDDSDFAIKLGFVDEFCFNEWENGGALCGRTFVETSPEERKRNRRALEDICYKIKARVESGRQ